MRFCSEREPLHLIGQLLCAVLNPIELVVGCSLYSEDGWKTFVEDNDIRVGDVVKIGYKIPGNFTVRVVRDGAEIVAIDWEKDSENAGSIDPPTPETPIARRGRKPALDGKSIELAKVRK